MRTVSSFSPSGVIRTITLRRRCRSTPTYCRCCIGVFLRREGFGSEAPSVPTLGPPRRRETPLLFDDDPPTPASRDSAPGPHFDRPGHARAALRSFIRSSSNRRERIRDVGEPAPTPP